MKLTNVLGCGILGANTEPDDEIVIHIGWNHVEFSGGIDSRQELLIQLVGTEQSKADKSNLILFRS